MLAVSSAARRQAEVEWEPVQPSKIAAGNAHSVVISWPSGDDSVDHQRPSLWTWGCNRHQQLGTESQIEASSCPLLLKHFDPEIPREDAKDDSHFIVDVACGTNHTMVLERLKETDPTESPPNILRGSQLWSVGNNSNGQLGRQSPDGKTSWGLVEISVPREPDVQAVVQRVCCGADHTLAIVNFVNTGVAKENGRVFAWGISANGALGTRRRGNEWTPTEVWFDGVDVVGLDGEPGTSIRKARVTQLAAGSKHSMAVLHTGQVFSWGHGGNGRLGLGKEKIGNLQKHQGDAAGHFDQSYSAHFEPQRVCMGPHESNIKYITAGESHSGAVDQLGRLYTWGQGAHGRCGNGMSIDIMLPTEVDSLLGVAIQQISFGLMHSVATTVKGTLYTWGKGAATGLDAGTIGSVSTPTLVKLEASREHLVYQIAAGPMHTLVLMDNGEIYCFGSGSENRMPYTVTDVRHPSAWQDKRTPARLPKGKREFELNMLNKTTDVSGWSKKEQEKWLKAKEPVKKNRGEEVKSWWPMRVFAGGANSVCLLQNKDLYMWGSSVLTKECVQAAGSKSSDNDSRWTPSLMKRGLQSKVAQIAVGAEHVLVINGDAVMFAWGAGGFGQLGTGSLKNATVPTRISHPVDVLSISAGEEHSACILVGGEAYTWGNAEGGRLGVGGCLTEGYEMMPKQVGIVDINYDVLLESVSCGSQHTSFVSKDNELLTFGTGWFGRLGQGNVDNVYTPQVVNVPGDNFQVREARCAAFHTCILDVSGILWVTGRDSSVCNAGAGHFTTPVRFAPFMNPQRYVREIATSEQHTLAVTYTKDAQGKDRPAHELWVWGSNRMGQLGLPPETASHIDMPWQLPLPLGEKHHDDKPPQIVHVATGPAHSLVVAMHKRKTPLQKNGPDLKATKIKEPYIYSWGASGSGRLGVMKQVPSNSLALVGDAAPQPVPKRRARGQLDTILGPSRVDDTIWRPSAQEDGGQEIQDSLPEDDRVMSKETKSWTDVYNKLRHEDPAWKGPKLKEREEEIAKEFTKYMDQINKLWAKAKESPHDITEWNLRLKEKMLETGYIRLLKALGLGAARYAPRLEAKTKTDPQILSRLQHYEDMFFILQQQPLYLATLAKRLLTKRKDDPDIELFERVTSKLFAELGDLRTRNLYKALVRMVIRFEVGHHDQARRVEIRDMFEFGKSRLPPLMKHFCTHPRYMKTIAMPIVDPREPKSLVSRIIAYTVWMEKNVSDKSGADGTDNTPGFALTYDQYKSFRMKSLGTSSLGGDEDNKWRSAFAEQLKYYREFLVPAKEKESKDAAPDQGNKILPASEFVEYFVREYLGGTPANLMNTDFQQLFRFAFEEICLPPKSNRYRQQNKDPEKGRFDPSICVPLSSLLLCGMIGGVLEAVVTEGSYALVRIEIKKQAAKHDAKQNPDDPGQEPWDFDPDLRFEKVKANIQTLADTLKGCVHSLRMVRQGQGGDEKESDVMKACEELTDVTNLALLKCLDANPQKKGTFDEDATEADLAVDLYRAHYNMHEIRLTFPTQDLMSWSNLLWQHMNDPDEGSEMRLKHEREKDPVFSLVLQTLPRPKKKDAALQDATDFESFDEQAPPKPWPAPAVSNASYVGESHNFIIHHRFLEYRNTELNEPTFCEESLAPMPRNLCLDYQRRRRPTTARVVKPFRRGTPTDREEAFNQLEEVISELASGQGGEKRHPVYRIDQAPGRTEPTFGDLRVSFEEILKDVSVKLEEGTFGNPSAGEHLLKQMQAGIKCIDKIKDQNLSASHFFEHIDKVIKERTLYQSYLDKMMDGKASIGHAQKAYDAKIKDHCALLTEICKKIDACDIHDDILVSSQMYVSSSSKLGFVKAKAAKSKMPPTPAMVMLREMKKNDLEQEVKDSDLLKAEISVPSQTFSVKELINKGVVVSLNNDMPKNVRNSITFKFTCADETVTVQAFMHETLLKEFEISREDIRCMEGARKNAVVTYGTGLFDMSCFRLRRLLANIHADGGL